MDFPATKENPKNQSPGSAFVDGRRWTILASNNGATFTLRESGCLQARNRERVDVCRWSFVFGASGERFNVGGLNKRKDGDFLGKYSMGI